jgi:hypothetical protein
MLDQAADPNGSDMARCRKGPRQGEANVDQCGPAKAGDIGDRSPDRLGGFPVRLGPQLAAGDTDPVEDTDIVVWERAGQATFGYGDDPRVHAEQSFDHRVASGLLGILPGHAA